MHYNYRKWVNKIQNDATGQAIDKSGGQINKGGKEV